MRSRAGTLDPVRSLGALPRSRSAPALSTPTCSAASPAAVRQADLEAGPGWFRRRPG